jgi:hypothetical protein
MSKIKHKYTDLFLNKLSSDYSRILPILEKDLFFIEDKVEIEKNGDESFFESKMIWNFRVLERDKFKIIKGFPQSLKSWLVMSCVMNYLLKYKISSVIVLQNMLDMEEQFTKRFKETFQKYFKFIEKNNHYRHEEEKEKASEIKICKGKNSNEKDFLEAMSGEKPKIFICLRNETDINQTNLMFSKMNTHRFALFIDEVDSNDSGCISSVQESIEILKKYANVIYGISATPITTLLKENINIDNVFIMTKPENYKDLCMVTLKDLPEDSVYCGNSSDNPFEKDPNLKGYIEDFSVKDPFYLSFYNQYHPRYSLVRIGHTIEPQLAVADFVNKNYFDKITTITYNGSSVGITLTGINLPKHSICLPNSKHISRYENNSHHFFCHIGKIIEYLQNEGYEKHPRIIVFAGKLSDRGISFGSSNYGECKEKGFVPWHITELYITASKGMNQPNLIQTVSRICGVFEDDIPLTIYSNVCNDIKKCYHLQEELIYRSRNNLKNESKIMSNLILSQEISKIKCSKRRLASQAVFCQLNKVDNDSESGGWDWKSEGRLHYLNIAELPHTNYKERINNIKIDVDIDKEEFERLTNKMFPLWSSKRDQKISCFLSELDPVKKYTKNELLFLANEHGLKRLSELSRYDRGEKSKGYGKIIIEKEGLYYLRPCLVEYFVKYF